MRFLLFCLVLLCGAAAPNLAQRNKPRPAAGLASFLALGDSYTCGQGVAAPERWPVQLAALARQQGLALSQPDIIARTGWTTAELLTAIEAANITRTYDLVSLQIGVNNQYRGLPLGRFRAEFRQLLRTAVRLAGGRAGRVLVLSTPDWGLAPANHADQARIGQEINQLNAVARAECKQAGIAFVDITPDTRAAAGTPGQFAPDGLHYSGPHMRRWALAALPVVQTMLR